MLLSSPEQEIKRRPVVETFCIETWAPHPPSLAKWLLGFIEYYFTRFPQV
jgi:hypothetical protein